MLFLLLIQTVISSDLALNCECSESELGDGICDRRCVTPQCNYDSPLQVGTIEEKFEAGDCYSKCLNACSLMKIFNESCDSFCDVQKCAFDLGRCGYCSSGCFESMLGNGECDDKCNNYGCGFDSGDCGSCAVGCFPSMLGDGTCDKKCDNSECNYDDSDCTNCSEDCTESMRNNDTCEPECFIAECNFDNYNCGCSSECTEDEIGTCSRKCLTYNCDFDPGCSCGKNCDENYRRFRAIASQMITQDLRHMYSFSNACESNSCRNQDLLDGFNGICHLDKCQSEDCLYQLGACNHDVCAEDCLRCANAQICFECDPQATNNKNRLGECVSRCNFKETVYEICLKNKKCKDYEMFKLCVPDIDDSSMDQPHVLIVDPSSPEDFDSIQSALDYAWKKHTKILIKEGIYTETWRINNQSYSKEMNITFEGNPKATIKLLTTEFQLPDNFKYIHLKNLVFDGSQAIKNDCETDSCTYCPYVLQQNQMYYDDRGNEVEDIDLYNYSTCKKLNSESLIETKSRFFIENCEFKDIRYGSDSLIRVRNNDLHILNTNFTNILTRNTEDILVIYIISENANSFVMEGGTVKLVNNGFEYMNSIEQLGFIYAKELNSVLIKDVTFEFNTVLAEKENFINILDTFKTEVSNCKFDSNLIMGSLLNINNKSLKLKDFNIDTDGYCEECSETNIFIHGNKFVNCQVTESLIAVKQESITNNVQIHRNIFDKIISNRYIIEMSRETVFSLVDVNGGETELDTVDSGQKQAIITPKSVDIEENTFEDSLCLHHLDILKLPNIVIGKNNLKSIKPTQSTEKIVEKYIKNNATYMQNSIDLSMGTIYQSKFVVGDTLENFKLKNLAFSDLHCYTSPCLVDLKMMKGSVLLKDIYGSNSNQQMIELNSDENSLLLTLEDIEITGIYKEQIAPLVHILDFTQVLVRNVHFKNSTSPALHIMNVNSLEIRNYSLDSISTSEGAVLIRTLSTDVQSNLTISDLSLANCYLNNSGGILLRNNGDLRTYLDISNSNFTNNYAYNQGSALDIRQTVNLRRDSTIRNCNFINNEVEISGNIYITAASGFLNINDCYFENNKAGDSGSDLFVHSSFDFYVSINRVIIAKSYGVTNVHIKSQHKSIEASFNDLRLEHITSGGVVVKNIGVFNGENVNLLNVTSDTYVFLIEVNGEHKTPEVIMSGSSFKHGSGTTGAGFSVKIVGDRETLLTIIDCVFESNLASQYGSAVFVGSSMSLHKKSAINNSIFRGNEAQIAGTLSLQYRRGTVKLNNCTFEENKSAKEGSAIYYSTSYGNSIEIVDSVFTGNDGLNCVYVSSFIESNSFTTTNCRFHNNSGSGIYINQGNWTDSDSEFTENHSTKGGGAFVLENSSIGTVSNSKFYKNSGEKGGAGMVLIFSKLAIDDCVFESNSAIALGGALYLEKDSEVHMKSSPIFKNTANSGSAIAFSSCKNSSTNLKNVLVYENRAEDSKTIHVDQSTIYISDMQFYSNTALASTSGIYLAQSEITISDSRFYDQKSLSGSFIYSTGNSIISIQSSTFTNGISQETGGAIYSFLGKFTIVDCIFDKMDSPDGAVLYLYFGSEVILHNSTFTNSASGSVISLFDSDIQIENSSIEAFSYSAIDCRKGNLIAKNITIKDGQGVYGTGIHCLDCISFAVDSSNFNHLEGENGGALFIKNQEGTDYFTISQSTFINNEADNGGAIYIENAKVSIEHSSFESNSAEVLSYNPDIKEISEGRGGAIFFTHIPGQVLLITSNYFINNSATYNGGAIAWEKSLQPELTLNTFTSNSAMYGPEYSSFATGLVQVSADGAILSSRLLTDLNSVVSGQKIAHFAMAVVDHYGQIVQTDNVNTVSVSGEDEIALSRTTKVTTEQGIANFTELVVSAPPGTAISVAVSADGIQSEFNHTVSIEMYLRFCEIGEVIVGNDCIECLSGTYSLNPAESQCRQCLSHAECFGKNNIVPLPGYWRSSNSSHTIWECPNSQACQGGLPDEEGESYQLGRCAEGYTGNKCQSCQENYSRTTPNVCLECPDIDVNIIVHVLVGFLAVLAICVIVKITMDSAYKEREEHSIYIKIFINYTQLVAIIANFNLKWPDIVLVCFRIFIVTSSAGIQYISFDCFFEENAYFNKLLTIALMPVLVCLISVVVWLVISAVKQEWKYMKHELIATIVIILFFMHPNLMTWMFSSMNCTEIEEGEYWLEDEMDIACWESTHIFYVICVSLPTIVLWGILIPAFCQFYLYKQKRLLDKIDIKMRFGFVYNGFVKRAYFWEFVTLYRKIIIICCAVFVKRISAHVQGLVVLMVLAVSLILHVNFMPFRNKELNDMELKSIAAATITIFCGLFFLNTELDLFIRAGIFAVMLIVNGYFLFGWTVKIFGVYFKMLTKKVPFFRRLFHKQIHPWVDVLTLQEKERHVLGIPNEKYYSIRVNREHDIMYTRPYPQKFTVLDLFKETVRQFNSSSNRCDRALAEKVKLEHFEEESKIDCTSPTKNSKIIDHNHPEYDGSSNNGEIVHFETEKQQE